ncbi:RelA/SpoT domain-containing protein [Luteibacter flocculans]|uniref:RelA/SpoT domain-containing protein n=1 Tax=Luteibacter flocculans TaxID=2780091 RepID=A0ABY4T6A5_9GAMM|nr:RelA/SpoT domain-containing protein [Luteibacter flocculans]URL59607.1 RelA/SpoT domain-containing protein [Luteibacter flocculans]
MRATHEPSILALRKLGSTEGVAKIIPQYSMSQIDRAGEEIARGWTSGSPGLDEALAVVNNWRQSHAHPLNVLAMTLRNRAQKQDPHFLLSQRLKRLPSIQRKLTRDQTRRIRLTQIQDMGGCRAIVSDMEALHGLVETYREAIAKNPKGRHTLVGSPKDYVVEPKADGYRSVHYVFRYASISKANAGFNGRRIEIQLRSKLQHAWATAMESVDTITGQSLKFAHNSTFGDVRWKRFFSLMSSAIAIRESQPLVPGTPTAHREIVSELKGLAERLNVDGILRGFGVLTADTSGLIQTGAAQFLLILDSVAGRVTIRQYANESLEAAAEDLLRLEREADPTIQAVLVNVDDVHKLRAAYPNYYLDTSLFLDALDDAIR